MAKVIVVCDRCGSLIEGAEYAPGPKNKLGSTSGFYRIAEQGKGWGKYTDPGERIVCDACMWKDPRYQRDYGANAAKSLGD